MWREEYRATHLHTQPLRGEHELGIHPWKPRRRNTKHGQVPISVPWFTPSQVNVNNHATQHNALALLRPSLCPHLPPPSYWGPLLHVSSIYPTLNGIPGKCGQGCAVPLRDLSTRPASLRPPPEPATSVCRSAHPGPAFMEPKERAHPFTLLQRLVGASILTRQFELRS
jgi:hypothetical protein